jgi:hypothetical protein
MIIAPTRQGRWLSTNLDRRSPPVPSGWINFNSTALVDGDKHTRCSSLQIVERLTFDKSFVAELVAVRVTNVLGRDSNDARRDPD